MAYNHEQAKAYLYTLARPDKKINFYFSPLVKLSEPRGENHKPFSIYCSKDETCYYTLYINGKEIHFDDDWKKGCGLSLKPGNYKIRVYVYIKHAVGTAYKFDHNLIMKSNSYEQHTMSDPYWQERRFDHTWDITMTEYNEKVLSFLGHMYGEFRCQYNQDYYHVKYADYKELMYYLDNVVEHFDFYETTNEGLRQFCSYWAAGIEFDYNDVDMNLVNQLTPKPKPSITPKFTTSITNSTNYVGELENDYKHGFGIHKVPTYNYTYVGEYYNNKRAGFGFYLYDDGDVCFGFNRNNMANGFNLFIKEDTHAYARIYEDNKISKKLTTIYYFKNNEIKLQNYEFKSYKYSNYKYVGQSYFDNPFGFGKAEYADGSIYIGQFSLGKRKGIGYLLLPNNKFYMGSFDNDLYNGYGVLGNLYEDSYTYGYFRDCELKFSI